MREVQRSPDPAQRTRWWMYRSYTTPPAQSDHVCVPSRVEHVTNIVHALPAPVNTAYWDRLNMSVLEPDDDSDDELSHEEVEEVVVLFDDEPQVQMVGKVVAVVEGDSELPIYVEKLSDVVDLSVIVKKEVQEVVTEVEPNNNKKKAEKRTISQAMHHSEHLKMLKMD
ncbi:hypothetical protein ZWY2020_013786 [Hordeum vulgare]|nr:hypothetical protein ZWY2020_013786 [Hordeum vulgare]